MSRRRGRAEVVTGANLSPMTHTHGSDQNAAPTGTPSPPPRRHPTPRATPTRRWACAPRGRSSSAWASSWARWGPTVSRPACPWRATRSPRGCCTGVRPSSSPRRWGPSPRSCTGPGRAAVGIEVNATHHRGARRLGARRGGGGAPRTHDGKLRDRRVRRRGSPRVHGAPHVPDPRAGLTGRRRPQDAGARLSRAGSRACRPASPRPRGGCTRPGTRAGRPARTWSRCGRADGAR